MDLTKIDKILDAESTVFREAVQTAIAEAGKRRGQLKSEIYKSLGLNEAGELSEQDFFAVLDEFEKISKNLGAVLDQAGFDSEIGTAWLAKKNAPKANFRRPTIMMLLEVVIDYYADARLFHDLHIILEEWGHSLETLESKPNTPRSELLFMKLVDCRGYEHLSFRTKNCFKNANIKTVGELAARSEAEMLRLPNYGRKSLKEATEFLSNFGLGFNGLSEAEYKQVFARCVLNDNAGKLLVTEWQGGLKQEYERLSPAQREEQRRAGEELYETVKADPELINALEEVGITQRTQLATAPKKLLDSICEGHAGWGSLLLRILDGRDPDRTYHGDTWRIELGLVTPPHLKETVEVYKAD